MAKLTDDQIRFIIDIEATGAQGQINTLQAEIGKLEKQNSSLSKSLTAVNNELTKQEKKLQKMEASGKQGTVAYKQLQGAIEQNRLKQQQLGAQMTQNQNIIDRNTNKIGQFTASLKLNQMTMQQLRDRATQLRRQLDVTSRSASPETYQKLQTELSKTEKEMGRLAKKSQTMSTVLTTAAGTVVGLIGKRILLSLWDSFREGIQTITSFEAANASLAAVLGTTQDGIKRLTADAQRLGEVTEYTAAQVTQMQVELAKLGFNETEILDATQYILQFATATGADIPAAAKLAGAALRAFNAETSETQRYVSAMAVATTKSALDFSYLESSMSTIAPVANAFGFAIEDTVALLGTLANSGFDASSAATATRNILLNLADSGGKLAKALGQPVTSLDALVPALNKLQSEGVSLAEALELTDKRSVAAFETFLKGASSIRELRDSITGVGQDLADMQRTKLDTIEGSVKLLQSAWQGLMLQFYDSKGVFKDIVDFLIKVVTGMRNLVKWVQDNAKAIKIFTGILLTYLTTGKAITIWRKADIAGIIAQTKAILAKTTATKAAQVANEALKKSLLKSPWGLLAIAITAAVAGLVLWIKHANQASAATKALNEAQERTNELAKQNTEAISSEQTQLNALVGAIIETNDNEQLRSDLIDQLQKLYPEFLGNLEKEKITNELLQGALYNANAEYERRIELLHQQSKAQAYQEILVDLNKQLLQQEQDLAKADSEKKKSKLRKEIEDTQEAIRNMENGYKTAIVDIQKAEENLEHFNSLEGLSNRLEQFSQAIAEKQQKASQARTEKEKAYYEQQAKELTNAMQALQIQYDAATAKQAADAGKARKEQEAAAAKMTDEAYKEALKQLQDSYATRKAEIIRQEAAMTITKEQSARQQLELAKEAADAELDFAHKHGKETGDLQIKAANAQIALNKDNYLRMEKDLQQWLDDSLRAELEAYKKGEISQDMYEENVRDLRAQHLSYLKELIEKYGMDATDIEKKITDNEIKNRKDADKKILEAAKKARAESLKLYRINEKSELDLLEKRFNAGLLTETEYERQRQAIAETYAKARLGVEVIYAEAVKNLDAEVVKDAELAVSSATAALNQTLQDRLTKAQEFTGELRDIFAETSNALGDTLGGQLMGHMANAMDAIRQFQDQSAAGFESVGQKVAAHVQMIGSVMSQALAAASQLTQQIFEMEANQLEAAKQKELAAVGDNAEEKERIEREYAQKELDLKKKQADADAAIQSASLWVNTAMGIATAWATSMQLGPIAGPIIAAVLTAALLATAGIQQANIIAQRDAIKNQTLDSTGGSTASINTNTASAETTTLRPEYQTGGQGYSDGGYTGDGGVNEPAGVVHKGEYVVSQAELKNPNVVPMVRAIESARQQRKHGRTASTTGGRGYADGGYTGDTSGVTGELISVVQDLANQVQEMKSKKIEAELNYWRFKEIEKKMTMLKAKGEL